MARNKLTLAVLELCHRLMAIGAYANLASVVDVTSSLIALLNGVSDLVNPSDEVRWVHHVSSKHQFVRGDFRP